MLACSEYPGGNNATVKILLVTSELHPFSKSGGLADMVGALAKTLAADGNQVGVVTPLYRGIREKFPGLEKFDWTLDLPLGPGRCRSIDESRTV